MNVPVHQNQISTGPIPNSRVSLSMPTDISQEMSRLGNDVQLLADSIENCLQEQRTRLPSASNDIAQLLFNQRSNVETPPPAFETVVNFNPSPLSNCRSAENSHPQNTTIDPPPPYPGPPTGESSL